MKKSLIKIICVLIFGAAILTIGSNGYILLTSFIESEFKISYTDILYTYGDLSLTFIFSFLELKAGIGLYKAIKENNKFEWYKSFPGLVFAIITPIGLSYLLDVVFNVINNSNKISLDLFLTPTFFLFIPIVIVYVLNYFSKKAILKRQTIPLNIFIFINSIITLIYIVTNKEAYATSSDFMEIVSLISYWLNVVLVVLIILFITQNLIALKKNPNILEEEARNDEVSEVITNDDSHEVVNVYNFKAEDENKTKLPKLLLLISSITFIVYGVYYLFFETIPFLTNFDYSTLSNTSSSYSADGLIYSIFSIMIAIITPVIAILPSVSSILCLFKYNPVARFNLSLLSRQHTVAIIPVLFHLIYKYIEVIIEFVSTFKVDDVKLTTIEIFIIVPIIIDMVICTIVQKKHKFILGNLKDGDSFYEYRKDAAFTATHLYITYLISGISSAIFAEFNTFDTIIYILLVIASTLGFIAMLIQVKYPMSEYTKVTRNKLDKEENQ